MEIPLKINNVSKSYGSFHLSNLSFTLPKGHIMGFIGANGSGKTTTIKLILNMIRKDSGSINIFNLDHVQYEEQIKQDIGVVFDHSFLCERWNAIDAERALKGFYRNWDTENFHRLIQKFKLSPKKEVRHLSRGMQMRLMLACALSHDAKLLILDEPTSGLDPIVRDELLSILAEYTQNNDKSVLFSTHITSDLEKIADYITFIDMGTLIYTGKKEDLIHSFKKVEGKCNQITKHQKEQIFGYREFNSAFEGIIHTELTSDFSNFSPKSASIDEIMVFLHKGESEDE